MKKYAVILAAIIVVFFIPKSYISSPGFVDQQTAQDFEASKPRCIGFSKLTNAAEMAADAPGKSLCFGWLVKSKAAAPTPTTQENTGGARVMDIDTYVRMNISALSPIKEQLGGTFQATSIKTDNGTGVVSYEDGHNAYTADFTYLMTDAGIAIESFTVRK